MKNWDKILDDFARKCKGGAPDMTNSRHLALLRESLIKFGWKENATNEFIGNLRNGKEIVVEKREPGETWKTAKGWAGLKPGEDKARYGMDSEESAVAYVSGKGNDEEEPKVNFDEENELNDEKHREKVRKQYEKQREKRKKEYEALIAKYPEHKERLTELYEKVDKFYSDIDEYLSETDQTKRQELGKKLFENHNVATNKIVEGSKPGDDNLKFYHNDIYDNKELKNELPPEVYAEIQKRWGKVVPSSAAGHSLAMGLEKDGVKVKDPSNTAVQNLQEQDKKVKEAEDKYGPKSPEAREARKVRKKLVGQVRTALVGNTRRTSKPEMGKPRPEVLKDGKPDPVVEGVMSTPPLDGITRNPDGSPNSMSGLFGPIDPDPDGPMVSANSDEGKRKHFEHSVTQNTSLDSTIEELERQQELGVVGPEIVDTVKNHKKRMEDILRRVKSGELEYPSEEASRLVSESYQQMFDELASYETEEGSAIVDGHGNKTENKQPGNSMIANIAEQALYDTELAAGDEVYLPSSGTFPGGDKVKVTREGNVVERVESISVKVGDTGKFYGFPGEVKQYQKYHNDEGRIEGEPSYRDRHRNNSGEPGFATGIDDRLLSEPKYFNKMLEESGLSDAIRDPEKLRETLDTMSKCIAGKTASEGKTTPKNKKEVQKCVAAANAQLSELLDPEKLEELVGPNNAKLILGGGEDSALAFTNMVSFSAIIQTSNGLEGLSHNHMDMETHEQHTEEGSSSLRDYNFNFRHGESSRNGGLIAGMYKEKPDEEEPKVS
jgi:hypothetical protein|tara:strand:+ start:87 stop:2420 length:2334 start_codon:yes stop_codon:yes gene_type:complete